MKATVELLQRIAVAGVTLSAIAITPAARADVFVDLGLSTTNVSAKIANQANNLDSTETGLHLGAGLRRDLRGGGNIGVRLELDTVDSDLLLAVRAVDYRYNLSDRFAISGFLGAARLDLATPAYGYYLGGGVQFKQLFADWDLGIDLRIGDKIARDNLLPTDPQGGSPDNFYDLTGISVYLTWSF